MRRIASQIVLLAVVSTGCGAVVGAQRPEPSATVVVHASRALPESLRMALSSMDGVRWTRVATTAMVNLVAVHGPTPLPERAPGTFLPFSIGAAEPLPDPADAISKHLAAGDAVIPPATARLGRIAVGDRITVALGERRESFTVGGIVADPRTAGVEALVPLEAARRLGVTEVRDVVVGVAQSRRVRVLRAAPGLAAPVPVRVGSHAAIASPSEGRLLSLAEIKERFGEFSFVPAGGRWLEPDPAWVSANIAETDVPLLGVLKCHRLVLPYLIAAMEQVQQEGLSHLVRESAGCYGPRVQFGDTRVISRHTWGIAVDINPTDNGYGETPKQDRRLVEIMHRWGFSWGGVWLIPDGMHFEFVGTD